MFIYNLSSVLSDVILSKLYAQLNFSVPQIERLPDKDDKFQSDDDPIKSHHRWQFKFKLIKLSSMTSQLSIDFWLLLLGRFLYY